MNIELQITVAKAAKDKQDLWAIAQALNLELVNEGYDKCRAAEIKQAVLAELTRMRDILHAGGSLSPLIPLNPSPQPSPSVEEVQKTPEQWQKWWIETTLDTLCEGFSITQKELKTMVRLAFHEGDYDYHVERFVLNAVGDNLTRYNEMSPADTRALFYETLLVGVRKVTLDWFEQYSEYRLQDIRGAAMLQKKQSKEKPSPESSSATESESPPEEQPSKKAKLLPRPKFALPTPSKHSGLFDTSEDYSPYRLNKPISDSPNSQIMLMKKQSHQAKQAELDSRIVELQVKKLTLKFAQENGFERWYLEFYNESRAHGFSDKRMFHHLINSRYLETAVLGDWYSQMPPQDRTLYKLLEKLRSIYPSQGATREDIRKFEEYRMRENQSFADYDARKKSLYGKAYPVATEEMFDDNAMTRDVSKNPVFLTHWKQNLYKTYLHAVAAKEPAFEMKHNRPMTYKEIVQIVQQKEAAIRNIARYGSDSPEKNDEKRGKKRTRQDRDRSPRTRQDRDCSPKPEKKEVCRNFQQGKCGKGNKCRYLHTGDKIKTETDASPVKKHSAQRKCGFHHTDQTVKPHPYHACTDPKIKCNKCNKTGHLRYWCPEETCQKCKKKGHSTEAHSWSKTTISDF